MQTTSKTFIKNLTIKVIKGDKSWRTNKEVTEYKHVLTLVSILNNIELWWCLQEPLASGENDKGDPRTEYQKSFYYLCCYAVIKDKTYKG